MFRSAVAILVGLIAISVFVEAIEFLLVAFLNRGFTQDPAIYFGIRNQLAVLSAKFFYNALGGILGGYLTALIARRAPVTHGAVLAGVQAVSLAWAATFSSYARWTPVWVWIALILIAIPTAIAGAWLRQQQVAAREPQLAR